MNYFKLLLLFMSSNNIYAYHTPYINNYRNYYNNNKFIKKIPKLHYTRLHNITMNLNENKIKTFVPDKVKTFVPDMQRRTIMNVLLLASTSIPVLWMLTGFLYFFVPISNDNDNAGLLAKDANGAHYLIVKEDNTLEKYAINAVCTHLGCVVPWNRAANKFMCPCHGSQYDETGKVIRGPAPLSLGLANVNIVDEKVILSEWKDIDFRTNTLPWWIK